MGKTCWLLKVHTEWFLANVYILHDNNKLLTVSLKIRSWPDLSLKNKICNFSYCNLNNTLYLWKGVRKCDERLIRSGFSFNVVIKSSCRKQPTFRDDTSGFPAKWRLRNERRNSILMMFHYPDLGSDTSSARDFLLRSFLRCRYAGKPVVASQNVGSFLKLIYSRLRLSTRWTPEIQE